jgi:hypothetical protein
VTRRHGPVLGGIRSPGLAGPAPALVPVPPVPLPAAPVPVPPGRVVVTAVPFPTRLIPFRDPARAVGAGRPATRLAVRVRRAGQDRSDDGPGRDPLGGARLVDGPAPPGPMRPGWLGVGSPRARGQHGPARGSRRVLVHGRPAARDRLLARRAPLHGHDHAGATVVSRGAAISLRGTRRRLGRGFPGAARGRLGATLARRLDLEHARPAEVGDRRVDRTRHRIVERLHQQLAGRDHRRQRCRRKGCHPEGDNQGCVAARRHARRSPAARLDGWVTARQASAYRS